MFLYKFIIQVPIHIFKILSTEDLVVFWLLYPGIMKVLSLANL